MMSVSVPEVVLTVDDETSGPKERRPTIDEPESPVKRRRRTAVSIKRRRTKFSQVEKDSSLTRKNSLIEPQTLNRKLNKLTKKIDSSVGVTGMWASHLKAIENHIGSDVVVYFKEVIWLCGIPVIGFILILGFIVAPQLYVRMTEWNGYDNNAAFQWHNVFTGLGWMQETELFQGFYTGETVGGTEYYMSTAFLLTMLVAYCLYLVWIAINYTSALSKQYVEHITRKTKKDGEEGGRSGMAVPKVFSAWDFSVCKRANAQVRLNMIWQEIERFVRPRGTSKEQMAADRQQLFLNIGINVFLFALVFGLCAGVWFVVVNFSVDQSNLSTLVALPLMTSLFSLAVPVVFSVFETFERFASRKVGVWVAMLRLLFLQLGLFTAFVFYLIAASKCADLPTSSSFYSVCSAMDQRFLSQINSTCWETWVGQEVYRWQILDLLVLIVLSLLGYGGWKLLSVVGWMAGPVANVSQLLLHLLLAQSVSWFGLFYCPLMPIVMIIKLTIIFFWFRFLLNITCRPSQRPWQSRHVGSFFRFALAFSFALAFVAIIICILMLSPSQSCGPFRGLTSVTQALPEVTNKQFVEKRIPFLILTYLNTIGFKIFVTVGLIVILLFFRRRAIQKHKTLKLLRHSIQMVTKDKVYYMKMLQSHAKQNPYQMLKKLPTARPVHRTPSDASIHHSTGFATPVVASTCASVHDLAQDDAAEEPGPRYDPAAVETASVVDLGHEEPLSEPAPATDTPSVHSAEMLALSSLPAVPQNVSGDSTPDSRFPAMSGAEPSDRPGRVPSPPPHVRSLMDSLPPPDY